MPSPKRSTRKKPVKPDWSRLATAAVTKTLRAAAENRTMKKLGPKRVKWDAGVHVVAGAEMARLNEFYRGKKGVTDILSFEAPPVFREQGFLGELVLCLPVLKKQAKELGHSAQDELRVLVVHGILHLLGLDHEGSGPKARAAAKEMATLEAVLLGHSAKSAGERPGLINRARSSKS